MSTTILTPGIPYTTGKKLVAEWSLPHGLTTAAGTTVSGGTVTGTATVPTGASAIYAGLSETPAGMGQYLATLTVAGTALPDAVTSPYTMTVYEVATGTDMTSYTAIAAAIASPVTIAYTRDVPSTVSGGYLTDGSWAGLTAAGVASAVAGQVPINVISPATPQHLDVYRGDYYDGADGAGRTLSFTYQTGEAWPDTINTAHFTCTPNRATLDEDADAASLTNVAMTVDTATGDDRKVTLTLTNTQLATLTALSKGTGGYRFWVVANKDAHPATIRSGTMTVRPDPTA